jgi:phage protein D
MKFEDIAKKYKNFYSPPAYQIILDGQDILKKYLAEITSVTFEDTREGSDRFSFTVNDPKLEWLDSKLFEPGKVVEIKMGYLDTLTTMIIGEIISVKPSFPSNSSPEMEISGYDLSYQFTRLQERNIWQNKRDS